ncbi:glycosyltransferase [Paraconexibacter sp.]|uniref:glycosyltransferase n=1 Tax=Paraconexibacter sp. TaxID=2949640 RepID=UPI0035657C28
MPIVDRADVLVDMRRERPRTGIGRVIAAWREEAREHPWPVAVLERDQVPDRSPRLSEPRAVGRAARAAGAKLVHAGYPYALTPRHPPTLLTLYDTLQLERRDARAVVFRALLARNTRLAPAVLTISEYARDRISAELGLAADRVLVAPLAVLPAPAGTTDRTRPYALYVGNDKPHKRVTELLRWAPELLASRGLRLVAVLPEGSAAAAHGATLANVEVRTSLDDAQLEDLLGGATIYVSLAEGEGFGLVPLEAAARGVPSVLADAGAHREVMADGAEYCEADPDDLAAALDRALADREALGVRARARVDVFSWKNSWEAVVAAHRHTLAIL